MTVLITLTTAGTDTGPFDLYSDADGYVSAFETGVSKAALQAGYSSSLVPNTATTIRVKSTGVCSNYVDISITTTTTTTSSTTTTTTTLFVCADCRNWEYNGATIPLEGDVIFYHDCYTGDPQSIALSNGDPTGNLCNCDSISNPTSLNGTVLTQIGICTTTTTTTTLFQNLFFDASTAIGGYSVTAIDVNGVTPTLVSGANVPFSTDGHGYNTNQLGTNETLTVTIGGFTLNGCISVVDSALNTYQQNISANGNYVFSGLTINNVTTVQVVLTDNVC